MSSPHRPRNDVQFSTEQLKYLQSIFPIVVLGCNASEAEMRYYFGTQAVLAEVERRTRGNFNTPSRANVPAPG